MSTDYPKREENERALLGQCIMDPTALSEATSTTLQKSSFWRDDHGELWELLQGMATSGKPVDLVTVAHAVERRMRSTGKEAMGGVAYVVGLTRDAPPTVNAQYYAGLIIKDASRRDLLRAIDETRALANDGVEDPSELVDNLQALLAASEDAGTPDEGWQSIGKLMKEAAEHAEHARKNPEKNGGTSTGFYGLDKQMANMHGGDLIVLAARPGMGKTALALDIAKNVARASTEGDVAIFSLEMGGVQLGMRTIAGASGVSAKGMRTGRLSSNDLEIVKEASIWLSADLDGMYIEVKAGLTVPQMRARLIRLMRKTGKKLNLVVIDYLQIIRSHMPSGTPREQQISAMTRDLKIMAKDLDVPVILLAQLNRDCEKRADKRPIIADLRESGAIEQDADVVIFLFRPWEYDREDDSLYGLAEANVAKSRHGEPDVVMMHFDGPLTKFSEAPEPEDAIALD